MIQGASWTFSGARVLTYSFNLNFDINERGEVVPAPGGAWISYPAMSAAFARATDAWANVADISFANINSGNYLIESSADIAVALTGDDLMLSLGAAALGFFPDPNLVDSLLAEGGYSRTQYPRPEGDILFDNFHPMYFHLSDGGVGFTSMIHELGHALGLKHPFDDGGNGRPTLAEQGLAQYDNESYTLMSYVAGDPEFLGHAATPMPLDILAIQQIYGANMGFHAGDDNYRPALDGARRTIWDAGGTDLLDASDFSSAVTLDLRPGALMDFGGGTILGVAYNVTIENATGGAGNDFIYGNAADNTLLGLGGSDSLDGGDGNDTLTGGEGDNLYYGGLGDDTYIVSSSSDVVNEVVIGGGGGSDTVLASVTYNAGGSPGIEYITLSGTADIDASAGMGTILLSGNSGANVLASAYGESGIQTLAGGAGNDAYVVRGPTIIVLENPEEGVDQLSLAVAIDYALPANVERLTLDAPNGGGATVALGGNGLDNSITGAGGDNRIDGGPGADTMVGAGGADIYVVDDPGDTIVETLDSAVDVVQSSIGHTLSPAVEDLMLTGSAAVDGSGNELQNRLTGNAAANRLAGGADSDVLAGAGGNDTLDGGAGFDWMQGGSGDDTYLVDTAFADTALALSGEPGEYLSGGKRYSFTGADGAFSATGLADLTGDGLIDYVTLGFRAPDVSNWWYLDFGTNGLGRNLAPGEYLDAQRAAFAQPGHAGLDVYGNGGGSNSVSGSFSIQQVEFDYSGASPVLVAFAASFEQHGEYADAPALRGSIIFNAPTSLAEAVTENSDEGIDTVLSSVSYVLTDNVENLNLVGNGALTGSGNALDNLLVGNDGANALYGGSGDDTLTGGAGDDLLLFAISDSGIDSVADFADGDVLRVAGLQFSSPVTEGNGAALEQNQVQLASNGIRTTLTLGTDAAPGFDMSIVLDGVFSANQFYTFGSDIGFTHAATGSVSISGSGTQGQTLTASNTLADLDGIPASGAGHIGYLWYADGAAIAGATASTFVPLQAQVGKIITVVASYIDAHGTAESMSSSATDAIANVNDAPTGSVAVSGTPTLGQTLTASNTLADLDGIPAVGAGSIGYQWKADGAVIDGATAGTLVVTEAQVGRTITVTASYTDGYGTAESVTGGFGKAVELLAYSWREHTLLEGTSIISNSHSGTTDTQGAASLAEVTDIILSLGASRTIPAAEASATSDAVNLQDAIAILKMIVGLEVNGAGKPLSPYQAMAADFDGDGTVGLSDAIGVLKHVVGLPSPEPGWRFANEVDPSVPGKANLGPGVPAPLQADLSGSGPVHIGLVAYLSGDVDASFAGGAGAQDLDATQPDYFTALIAAHPGLSLSQFGVYPGQ